MLRLKSSSLVTGWPAPAGRDNFCKPSFPRPSYAFIHKALPLDLFSALHMAQIDQNGLRHDGFKPIKIESAKLLPFGYNHQNRGALRTTIGIAAEGDVGDDALGLLHAGRIIGTHFGAEVLQRRDERNRRRLAHVVGVGLERQAQDSDRFATPD